MLGKGLKLYSGLKNYKFLNVVTSLRSFASCANNTTKHTSNYGEESKVVFISQSSDVFSNLALEDWMYTNKSFTKTQVLLLWANTPCVVIGRHQNPYVECNLPYMESLKYPVARRNSGGGTVYHDLGNLNCTFFTSRDRYNRRSNLQILANALQNDFNVSSEIDCKDNILIEGTYKVSGTAAKLGRLSAYHHCTLLIDCNKQHLRTSLQGDKSINSNATASIPSPVKNLKEINNSVSVDGLLESVGRHYLATCKDLQANHGMTLINPSNDWFPGLDKIKDKLMSWTWKYGMTPKFTITRPVSVPTCHHPVGIIDVSVESYHGIIRDVKVTSENVSAALVHFIETEIGSDLRGTRYSVDVFHRISNRIHLPSNLSRTEAC